MGPRLQITVPNEPGQIADQLDEITEQIWREVNGRVSRARVRQVAAEVAFMFHTARITVFVPIFIRRATSARINEEIPRDGVRI